MFLVMTLRVNCYLIKLLLLTTMDKMKCLKRGMEVYKVSKGVQAKIEAEE
jgi:hypothetical protein